MRLLVIDNEAIHSRVSKIRFGERSLNIYIYIYYYTSSLDYIYVFLMLNVQT